LSTVISILSSILIIGLVIFIHEFGHYLLAKKNGIGVVEFSVGMGPAIYSWVKNGTKYAIRCLPFGGYCMMLGAESFLPDTETDGEEVAMDEELAFSNKPVWRRIAAIAAGPLFNVFLGLFLALLLTALVGVNTTEIGYISPDYPAESAGLQAGDRIVKLDNSRMALFQDITLYMAMHEGEDVTITYVRNGEKFTTTLTPVYYEAEDRYLIGITAKNRETGLGVIKVLRYGCATLRYNMSVVIKSLGMLVTGKSGIGDLSGPVGMAGIVNDIVEEVQEDTKEESGWVTFYWTLLNLMNFTLLITANLAVMNLLPIPGMDGGRLLFLLIEAVRGKPVEKKREGIVTIAGFILLFILVIFVFFNDIRKVFFM